MACYGRSPYFEFYQEPIQAVIQKKFTFLLDLNIESIRVINQLLDIKKQFHLTSAYIDSNLESVMDYRSQFTNHHYEPDRNIRYVQTFEEKTGFIPGLSILDFLFCEGKHAANLLCSP
jgi:hypothetical protein